MKEDSYYVFALKDPRDGRPFYLGKGTGVRAWECVAHVDKTSKGKRIEQIKGGGDEVIVSVLADGLTELQALKLESELIGAFGTEASGGFRLVA